MSKGHIHRRAGFLTESHIPHVANHANDFAQNVAVWIAGSEAQAVEGGTPLRSPQPFWVHFREPGPASWYSEMMEIRLYAPSDRAACLDMFDSNVPQFFDPSERASFEAFLDGMDCAYFVIEHEDSVAGCGGYAVSEDKSMASLIWGMVRSDLHGLGLGRFLLLFRLRRISQTMSVPIVRLRTSQHTAAFFEKQGFKAVSVEKDGFAPGIDRVEMVMKLAVCT